MSCASTFICVSVLLAVVAIVLASGCVQQGSTSPGAGGIVASPPAGSYGQAPGQGQTSGGNQQPAANNYNVEISGLSFNPQELSVKKGDAVTWTSMDSVPHTITSDSGVELNSGLLAKGVSYSHTFTQEGTFAYHCRIHTSMKGTITVEK